MNFLSSLSSAVIAASTSALSGGGGVPGLPGFTLGEKVNSFEGKSIWSLYEGVKKVSFSDWRFSSQEPRGRRSRRRTRDFVSPDPMLACCEPVVPEHR